MSKRLLQVKRTEAQTRIEGQIQKGDKLLQEGIAILESRRGSSESPKERDNFEVKYRQWEEFTSEILREIFVNGSYSHDFKEEHSSVVEYVGSSWVPDIKYYIQRQLGPKLDFLKILLGNLGEFVESPQSTTSPSVGAIATLSPKVAAKDVGDLDKLTIIELLRRLKVGQSVRVVSILIALLIGAFTFGYTVHSWKLDREKSELSRDNELLSRENARLKGELDSVKNVGTSSVPK
jgi:hypothetical protein